MIQLVLQLPDEVVTQLPIVAKQKKTTLSGLVESALYDLIDDAVEPTNEQILADLKEALQDVDAGRIGSAREMIEQLRQELHV